jgi:hypothetical protein
MAGQTANIHHREHREGRDFTQRPEGNFRNAGFPLIPEQPHECMADALRDHL